MKNKRGLFRLYLKSEPSTRADRILYVVTVIVSVILLIGGYWFAVRNGTVLGQNLGGIQSEEYRARITEVVSSTISIPSIPIRLPNAEPSVMRPCSTVPIKENRFWSPRSGYHHTDPLRSMQGGGQALRLSGTE